MFTLARRFRSTFVFAALASALVLADPSHEHRALNHAHRRLTLNLNETDGHFEKRFDGTRFTYFNVGTNACGSFDHDGDFIVALNTHQWDGGSHCYEEITITYQGKSTQAKITDECEECPYAAIDLSPGLFEYLVPGGLNAGEVYGSWVFGGGSPPPPSTTEAPPPPETTSTTHSSTPQPTTTSTSTPHTTSHSTTTKVSTSSTPTSTTPTSSSAAPAPTVTSWDSGSLNQLNLALIQLVDLSNAVLASPSDV
ncbi:hypothetical protein GSI_13579 [Ganoderma sinense ZZ0214-1]|uniref:RlpA-like protein double-psi beta-barrel domain-containing protein n=1 Tax=Ganoderma sinense ZZ0214-1 TaxID=1077348 RepID=A0A2G8RR66_9APHY|nr:hypothetical protein GSI_13579 [Ganoderma sinense ZZ0214-1]